MQGSLCPSRARHAYATDAHALMDELLPHSELLMIPGGSHVAPIEQPELLHLRFRDFLAKVTKASKKVGAKKSVKKSTTASKGKSAAKKKAEAKKTSTKASPKKAPTKKSAKKVAKKKVSKKSSARATV